MAQGNPLIAQGTLNKLKASVVWNDYPAYNITSSYLGREGISAALDGNAVEYYPTLTGAVTSPQPFLMVRFTVNILKTQSLADTFKQKYEQNALFGDCTVRPDATTLSPFQFVNCSMMSLPEMRFDGTTPLFSLVFSGYYNINSFLFN